MNKQLSIVNVVQYQYDRTSAVPRHKHHDIYQIFYVLNGTARYIVNGQEHIAEKNQFILVKPQSMHEMKAGKCDDYSVLDFKFTVSDFQLAEGLEAAEILHADTDRITQLFSMIHEELENTNALFDKIIYSHLEAILYMVTRGSSKTSKSNAALSEVIYINQKKIGPCVKKVLDALEGTSVASAQSGRINEIAKIVGYNKQYMCRTFSAEVGISLVKFQQLLKIDKAKEMMESTNYSVGEIADLLGYSSQSHFIKVFKENTGMSPLKYRRSGQKSARKVRYHSTEETSAIAKEIHK